MHFGLSSIRAVKYPKASTFFQNYSAESLNVRYINQSLVNLTGRLADVTVAINNAIDQAGKNAEAGKLAEKLNFLLIVW